MCDRIAIMVAGKLVCLGALQNIKTKFGKAHLLSIKIKEPSGGKEQMVQEAVAEEISSVTLEDVRQVICKVVNVFILVM